MIFVKDYKMDTSKSNNFTSLCIYEHSMEITITSRGREKALSLVKNGLSLPEVLDDLLPEDFCYIKARDLGYPNDSDLICQNLGMDNRGRYKISDNTLIYFFDLYQEVDFIESLFYDFNITKLHKLPIQ